MNFTKTWSQKKEKDLQWIKTLAVSIVKGLKCVIINHSHGNISHLYSGGGGGGGGAQGPETPFFFFSLTAEIMATNRLSTVKFKRDYQ